MKAYPPRKRNAHRNFITAASILRRDRGAMTRMAKKLGVHPSLVSRVASGKKTSLRVRDAIAEYLIARARELDAAAFLLNHNKGRK